MKCSYREFPTSQKVLSEEEQKKLTYTEAVTSFRLSLFVCPFSFDVDLNANIFRRIATSLDHFVRPYVCPFDMTGIAR